jgi:hypothetical protein
VLLVPAGCVAGAAAQYDYAQIINSQGLVQFHVLLGCML